MNSSDFTPVHSLGGIDFTRFAFQDLWHWSRKELSTYATLVFGENSGITSIGTRKRFLMANRDWCPASHEIDRELTVLGSDCTNALNMSNKRDWISVVAAFHLRFLSIHPMTDGNGRTARSLLILQCSLLGGFNPNETISLLQDFTRDYRMVFVPDLPIQRFELLVSLLYTLFGVPQTSILKIPFNLVWSGHSQRSAGKISNLNRLR